MGRNSDLSFHPGAWLRELCHHFSFLFLVSYIFPKDPPRSEPSVLGHLHLGWCQERVFAFISGGACPGFHALLSNPLLSCLPNINFLSFGFLLCFLALILNSFSWVPSIPLIWSSIFYFKDTFQAWVWKQCLAGSSKCLVIVSLLWHEVYCFLPLVYQTLILCLPSLEQFLAPSLFTSLINIWERSGHLPWLWPG